MSIFVDALLRIHPKYKTNDELTRMQINNFKNIQMALVPFAVSFDYGIDPWVRGGML